MKETIHNINCPFAFNNVCTELTKFWLNEIIGLNSSKIWLTVIVYNKKKKSYTLINNLPFNTLDCSDVIKVLKQVFEAKNLSNRKDLLNKIIFKFNFENYNINYYKLIWYILKYLYFIIKYLYFIIKYYLYLLS